MTERISQVLQGRGTAVAAAAVGLVVGIVAGAPAVAALIQVWRETVTPAFLELYLAGIPFCS